MHSFFCFNLYAAETNSDIVTVAEIRADEPSAMSNNTYYYTFKGTPGNNCGKYTGSGDNQNYTQSGDSNINRILYTAYVMKYKVKVGIESNYCVIATAKLPEQ